MSAKSLYLLLFLVLAPSLIEEKRETYRGLASAWNSIPSRSLAGLYYLFKGFEYDADGVSVKVSGPVVEITNGERFGARVHRNGFTSEIDPEDFEEEQILGQAVFAATTRTGTDIGTAFLVGQDVVLTNRHVLGYTPQDKHWDCGQFSVTLNHREEQVECEKVRYCNKDYDFCVVQMKKMSNGESLGKEIKPLRLARRVKNDHNARISHIGNAAGLGIQVSHGRGIKISEGEFYHYAPTLGGSSGAPIFNDKKEVIGINWAYTGGEQVDDKAFNRGVLSSTMFNELKKSHLYTLKEIKSFKTWLGRESNHRKSSIE